MGKATTHHTVLFVEDEADYRSVARLILENAGYEVMEAENGRQALDILHTHIPDIIVSDIQMPVMNGIEFLETVKTIPTLSAVPFLFLTGKADRKDIRRGMQHGANDYLTKPFTDEDLLAAVRTQLDKTSSVQHYFESRIDEIRESIGLMLPHELRTPLTAILGYAQLLESEEDLPADEVKRAGALIGKAGRRLNHLLENIIFFTTLQFWKHDPVRIKELRSDTSPSQRGIVTTLLERKIVPDDRRADLKVSVVETPLQISFDHCVKILEEILSNAVKFSAPGTPIELTSVEQGQQVRLRITDHGRGMTADEVKNVTGYLQFERKRFEQQGAGLGLAIASTLVELHDGSLSIQSEPNGGTVVEIVLPIAANP